MLAAAETENTAPTLPPDGFHVGIPHETYLSWDAVSSSRLKAIRQSPAHLRAEIDSPTKPTPEMELGTRLHTAILEPDAFFATHIALPDFAQGLCDEKGKPYASPKATNKYKALVDEWKSLNPGYTVLDADEYSLIVSIAVAVKAHPAINAILTATPQKSRELSALWTDKETGLRCKARFDVWCPALDLAMDLKSTADASRKAFTSAIVRFGYFNQGAWYLDALAALGEPTESFVFGAFEKKQPFGVAPYRIDEPSLELGTRQNRDALRLYAECSERGEWPGYSPEIEDISVPDWLLRQEGY